MSPYGELSRGDDCALRRRACSVYRVPRQATSSPAPHSMQILLTAGLSFALVGLAQVLFGADYRQVNLLLASRSDWLAGLSFNRAYVASFFVATAVSCALYLLVKRTELGRALRAVAQNRATAALMGIRVERVSAVAFALGVACLSRWGSCLSDSEFRLLPRPVRRTVVSDSKRVTGALKPEGARVVAIQRHAYQ